jgi:hypothetical protein
MLPPNDTSEFEPLNAEDKAQLWTMLNVDARTPHTWSMRIFMNAAWVAIAWLFKIATDQWAVFAALLAVPLIMIALDIRMDRRRKVIYDRLVRTGQVRVLMGFVEDYGTLEGAELGLERRSVHYVDIAQVRYHVPAEVLRDVRYGAWVRLRMLQDPQRCLGLEVIRYGGHDNQHTVPAGEYKQELRPLNPSELDGIAQSTKQDRSFRRKFSLLILGVFVALGALMYWNWGWHWSLAVLLLVCLASLRGFRTVIPAKYSTASKGDGDLYRKIVTGILCERSFALADHLDGKTFYSWTIGEQEFGVRVDQYCVAEPGDRVQLMIEPLRSETLTVKRLDKQLV